MILDIWVQVPSPPITKSEPKMGVGHYFYTPPSTPFSHIFIVSNVICPPVCFYILPNRLFYFRSFCFTILLNCTVLSLPIKLLCKPESKGYLIQIKSFGKNRNKKWQYDPWWSCFFCCWLVKPYNRLPIFSFWTTSQFGRNTKVS